MKARSGQAFLPDFLTSAGIFAVIAAVFLFSWNTVVMNQQTSPAGPMQDSARYTTTFLVSTPGYPEDWNSSNVEIPGFASDDNFLQVEKIQEFSNISYERQRELMTAENFRLVFRDSGEVVEADGENLSIGKKPGNASTIVPVSRSVLLNTSGGVRDVEMQYIVWRE